VAHYHWLPHHFSLQILRDHETFCVDEQVASQFVFQVLQAVVGVPAGPALPRVEEVWVAADLPRVEEVWVVADLPPVEEVRVVATLRVEGLFLVMTHATISVGRPLVLEHVNISVIEAPQGPRGQCCWLAKGPHY